jgi:MFS family permease
MVDVILIFASRRLCCLESSRVRRVLTSLTSPSRYIFTDKDHMRTLTPREHTAVVAALCLCTFTVSYLVISAFPYSGFMAISLVDGLDEENAGTYAGLLSSAFMIGRTFSSYGWGKVADTYGRLPVLYLSLFLGAVFTLTFGLSTNYAMAFISRFLLGFSNGILLIARTSTSEIAASDKKLETQG